MFEFGAGVCVVVGDRVGLRLLLEQHRGGRTVEQSLQSVVLPALDLMTHDVRASHHDTGTAATRIRLR
jgi:hypothetical protein